MKLQSSTIFILSLFPLFLRAQVTTIDKIAGVVGNNIILQSDIEMQYAHYQSQGNPTNQNIKCQFLHQLLVQKLLSQQAINDSITVSENQIDEELDRRMRLMIQRAGGQERLEEFLNRSILQYKEEFRPAIKEQLVASKMQNKITQNIQINPAEIKRYFESLPKDSLPSYGTEVQIGELVLYPKLTKEEKKIFYDKLDALRLRIKAGEDFSTLARLYSQDPGSATEGGELGFIERSTVVKEFAAVAFNLKIGELSSIFETEYGYHILQVTDRRGELANVRHILIKFAPSPASLTRTKMLLDSIYQRVIQKKLEFGKAVYMYSHQNESKYNGGMILTLENVKSRTTYLPIEKLDSQLFLTIDTMAVGTYSKPGFFISPDGKEGVRFVYLKSKTTPHKANLEDDLPRLKEAALSEKINQVVKNWFEKRRQSTYIKIDPEYQSCAEIKNWNSVIN